jgi:hypothetical protein
MVFPSVIKVYLSLGGQKKLANPIDENQGMGGVGVKIAGGQRLA